MYINIYINIMYIMYINIMYINIYIYIYRNSVPRHKDVH